MLYGILEIYWRFLAKLDMECGRAHAETDEANTSLYTSRSSKREQQLVAIVVSVLLELYQNACRTLYDWSVRSLAPIQLSGRVYSSALLVQCATRSSSSSLRRGQAVPHPIGLLGLLAS